MPASARTAGRKAPRAKTRSAGALFSDDEIWYGIPATRRAGGWGGYQDPVVGYVPLAPLLRQALDLPPVQRLRSIKQLSGLDVVYPGATHTRFEHAVGVMWLAGQAHDALAQKAELFGRKAGWPEFGVASKLAVMLAGLFHDLGHGPYSHTYDLFREREDPTDAYGGKHEERSRIAITELDEEHGVAKFLNAIMADLDRRSVPLAALLRPEVIAAIATAYPIKHAQAKRYQFLATIVAGQFDVDRLDYLRRDAMHTGVPASINPGEVIGAYTLAQVSADEPEFTGSDQYADAGATPTGPLVWRLKLERHAAPTFEALLAARDAAYRKLYYHRTHRAGQEMLILALQRLTGRAPEPVATTSVAKLSGLTDQQLLAAMAAAGENDVVLRDVYSGLGARRLYEPLPTVIRVHDWPQDALALLENLRKRENPQLRERMKRLSRRIDMNVDGERPAQGEPLPPERVLLDISETPVTTGRTYSERSLIDEEGRGQLIVQGDRVLRIGYSLNELLAHVNTLHGIRVIREDGHFVQDATGAFVGAPDRREPAHPAYLAQMQSILVFVPSSFLQRLHDQLRTTRGSARATQAKALYDRYLDPIIAEFWDVVADKFPGKRPNSGQPKAPRHESFVRVMEELEAWLRDEIAFPQKGARVTPPFLD